MNRIFLPLFLVCAWCSAALAQPEKPGKFWQTTGPVPLNRPAGEAWIRAEKSHAFKIDHSQLAAALAKVPKEFTAHGRATPFEIILPMPDGGSARFKVVESPIMAPELAVKFPELKTYVGQGVDDPSASVRFDVTPEGFHGQILSPRGAVYIDPAWRGDRMVHTSYYKRDYRKAADGFQCLGPELDEGAPEPLAREELLRSGNNLRIYRLACAATGEYVKYHGGTVAAGMSAIVTAINRVSGIYEVELAVRLVLVGNNNLLVYTNASTDPYNNTSGSTMLGQNQSTIDAIIGDANYDIGHVFSTGGGGVAGLGVVCRSSNKARGVTGLTAPIGDAFYIDYVAHEMGHQFGGNHTFNSVSGACNGNRNAATAYEPGSGSTIMPYAGICSADNLQPNSDPYFHSISFDEILTYTTTGFGNSCPVLNATGNTAPTVSAGASFTIPRSTPFTLTASGSDTNGDTLTYCWEERDLGAAQLLTDPDNGSSPIFRSFNPTTNSARTFPRLPNLLNNTSSLGEKLPTTDRVMNFRVTARDNRAGGGGVNTANMQVTVAASAGPFVVTSPNTSVTWSNLQTVTWNVAGTAATPVNASLVNILLSTNGGNTFPIVLAANTPNDGSEMIVLPSISNSLARVKVEAVGNIFFDVSNSNFSIAPSAAAPFINLVSATLLSESCEPGNKAIDPNEMVSLNFTLRNSGSLNTSNLVATLLSTNGVASPSAPQSYGAVVAGGAEVSRIFTFVASGLCGGTISPTLQLQDGTNNLGAISTLATLGGSSTLVVTNSNPSSLSIPTKGTASPYPSSITVSGVTGTLAKATISLVNFSHTYPDDVLVMLVGPASQTVMLMGAAGGSLDLNGVNLTFDSSATGNLPDTTQISSGTFLPSDFSGGRSLASPAPSAPYGSLSSFNGTNPNGTWSLYVFDTSAQDGGTIGSWKITLTTVIPDCCSGNSAPVISSITNRVTQEDVALSGISFTVSDAESVSTSLVVTGTSSNTNLVPNSNLIFSGTATNRSLAVIPSTNAFGSTTIAISVSDGTTNAVASFLLTVTPVNDAPFLAVIPAKTVDEGSLLEFTNSAFDVENDQLTFSLVPGAPAGATINTTNGIFQWMPSEAQGPSTNTFFIRVTDNGIPSLSTSQMVSATVNEVNISPLLGAVLNKTVYLGETLSFTNTASDSDIPLNFLQFSFDLSPSGAQLNATNGLFSWTPAPDQLGTNSVAIRLTDDGTPVLSDAKAFSVLVVSAPNIQSVTRINGEVTLTWNAVAGRTYRVQYKMELADSTWSELAGDVSAIGSSASKTDSAALVAQRFYRIAVLP